MIVYEKPRENHPRLCFMFYVDQQKDVESFEFFTLILMDAIKGF